MHSAKDLILAIIGQIGTAGANGHTIEYTGAAIRALTMEERMTVCNMSIEAGGRAGLIAVDDITLDYIKGRPFTPTGELWDLAFGSWRELNSDTGATFDSTIEVNAADIEPQVTWGTSPENGCPDLWARTRSGGGERRISTHRHDIMRCATWD